MAGVGSLIPEMQPYASELLRVAGSARLNPRVTSARRTHAQQARLYRNYLAGAATYPVAPPGTSAHEYGFAFDVVTSPLEALDELGAVWEEWGGIWGGRFNDPVHFEFPGFSKLAVQRPKNVAQFYEDLPWWAQLAIPTQLTPTTRPIDPPPAFVQSGVQWLGAAIEDVWRGTTGTLSDLIR